MNAPIAHAAASERLWTAGDVADFLRVKPKWVYAHSKTGRLPSLRIVGGLRFEPEEIKAWAREQRPGRKQPQATIHTLTPSEPSPGTENAR